MAAAEPPTLPKVPREEPGDHHELPRQLSVGTTGHKEISTTWLALKVSILFLVLVVAPLYCRFGHIQPDARCGIVIVAVLLLNLGEVMPLYCTALFIPVLGTLCATLGEERGLTETSSLLVGNIFNNISFLVLGALVINGIFVKCQLERRFMRRLIDLYHPASSTFLLVLLMGGMAMCSVLYSGSLILLAALRPLMDLACVDATPPNASKRLLLAVGIAANAGSTWFPISSPVNLITIALLGEFDTKISFFGWTAVAVPIATLVMLAVWAFMASCYLASEQPESEDTLNTNEGAADQALSEIDASDLLEKSGAAGSHRLAHERDVGGSWSPGHHEGDGDAGDNWTLDLSIMQKTFLAVGCLAILAITVFAKELEPVIGHPACVSLAVVVVVFGSGFMSREEFLQLDWDLLALVGGSNVMAFLVRETGMGATLSARLVGYDWFTALPYWGMITCLVIGTMCVSTLVGHTLTGVLLMPLIVALGVKLQAAETTAILCAIAIPLGMGMPHSSFDNLAAYVASRTLGRPQCELSQRNFRVAGGFTTCLAAPCILLLGFAVCIQLYGMPPPVVVSETGTPNKLKPKVVKENIPKQATELNWSENMANWEDFRSKRGKKAFAVSRLREGYKTRGWAAAWGHPSQESANKAAIEDCERIADKCYLIYPEDARKQEEVDAARKVGGADVFLALPPGQRGLRRRQFSSVLLEPGLGAPWYSPPRSLFEPEGAQ